MKLEGRRESTNVEDRRGMSGGTVAGLGIGGILIIGLITLMMGGNLGDVLNNVVQQGAQQTTTTGEYTPSAEEEALVSFTKKVFAGTGDIWTRLFAKQGYEYQPPKLILYSGTTSSGCGTGVIGPAGLVPRKKVTALFSPRRALPTVLENDESMTASIPVSSEISRRAVSSGSSSCS